jgi:hypothetical protein
MKEYLRYVDFKNIHFVNQNSPKTKSIGYNIRSVGARLWQKIVAFFSNESKLKVRSTRDSRGEIWWHIYDPATNRSAILASEAEIRNWLDERYSHQP